MKCLKGWPSVAEIRTGQAACKNTVSLLRGSTTACKKTCTTRVSHILHRDPRKSVNIEAIFFLAWTPFNKQYETTGGKKPHNSYKNADNVIQKRTKLLNITVVKPTIIGKTHTHCYMWNSRIISIHLKWSDAWKYNCRTTVNVTEKLPLQVWCKTSNVQRCKWRITWQQYCSAISKHLDDQI